MRIESSHLSLGVKHNAEPTDSHRERVGALARPLPRLVPPAAAAPADVTDPSVTLTPKQMRDLAAIEEMLSRLMAMPVKLRPLRVGPITTPTPADTGMVTFGDGAVVTVQQLTVAQPGKLPAVSVDGGRVRFIPGNKNTPGQASEGASGELSHRINLTA